MIPVTVIDLAEIARAELAENSARKDFLPSEIEAIRRTLLVEEKAAAKERMTLGKVSTGSGKTRDKIGAFVGISGKTVEKIATVVDAAERQPEKYARFVEKMDRTGKVDGVFRELKVAQQAEGIRLEQPPLPGRGPYRVIVVDPPWQYDLRSEDPSHSSATPYPTMTVPGDFHATCCIYCA